MMTQMYAVGVETVLRKIRVLAMMDIEVLTVKTKS